MSSNNASLVVTSFSFSVSRSGAVLLMVELFIANCLALSVSTGLKVSGNVSFSKDRPIQRLGPQTNELEPRYLSQPFSKGSCQASQLLVTHGGMDFASNRSTSLLTTGKWYVSQQTTSGVHITGVAATYGHTSHGRAFCASRWLCVHPPCPSCIDL